MLPGLRIASPDERDYWAELTSLASRQYVRPDLTYGTTGPCRKSLTRRTGLLGKSRLVTTISQTRQVRPGYLDAVQWQSGNKRAQTFALIAQLLARHRLGRDAI